MPSMNRKEIIHLVTKSMNEFGLIKFMIKNFIAYAMPDDCDLVRIYMPGINFVAGTPRVDGSVEIGRRRSARLADDLALIADDRIPLLGYSTLNFQEITARDRAVETPEDVARLMGKVVKILEITPASLAEAREMVAGQQSWVGQVASWEEDETSRAFKSDLFR